MTSPLRVGVQGTEKILDDGLAGFELDDLAGDFDGNDGAVGSAHLTMQLRTA